MIGLIAYAFVGAAVAAISLLWLEEPPEGSKPAILFVVGLLWPLTVLAFALTVLWFAASDVCHGFAALWRHARGRVEAREERAEPPPPRPTTSRRR